MHPSILAQRKAQAMDRIVRAAGRLDPEHAEALQPKGIKDPQAAEMVRLEAIADLLERLEAPVTAVTAEGLPPPTLDADPEPRVEPEVREPATPSKKSTGRKSKK